MGHADYESPNRNNTKNLWDMFMSSANAIDELRVPEWPRQPVEENERPTDSKQHVPQMAAQGANGKSERSASHEGLDKPRFVEVPAERRKRLTPGITRAPAQRT